MDEDALYIADMPALSELFNKIHTSTKLISDEQVEELFDQIFVYCFVYRHPTCRQRVGNVLSVKKRNPTVC